MHSQQVHTILSFVSFLLSIFLVIAAAKYASWAKVMVNDSGSWLGLVLYLVAVPVLSLLYALVYIALLHFGILPTPATGARALAGTSLSTRAALFLFVMSIIQFVWWLGQASLCTACELGPILAGHEGQVPGWCPQSRFVDKGIKDLPNMLGQLAIIKDSVSWVMVLISVGSAKCAQRQWTQARMTEGEISIGLAPDYETGGKGLAMAASKEVYEMGGFTQSGRSLPRAPQDTSHRPGHVEIGAPPSRRPTVATNLDTGMGYESRI